MKFSLVDIEGALRRMPLISLLGYQDIRQRYQRSFLGPFWLTISMGIMIACIGIVFGTLFQSSMEEFLPFLAVGLILWAYILSCVTEGSSTFISEAHTIQQIPLPLTVFLFKMVWRNLIILAHNLLILPLIILIFGVPLSFSYLLFLPGLVLLTLNLVWVTLLMSVVCTRFRDLPQIMTSLMQVLFYISPILWSPALLEESHRAVILDFNPIYYLLDITRSPLLGQVPDPMSWVICVAMLIFGNFIALSFFGRFRDRIPYWL